MATNAIDAFRMNMKIAKRQLSHGGTTITPREVEEGIRTLVFPRNATIDRGDFNAAAKYFKGKTFAKYASESAVEEAGTLMSALSGRWSIGT